VPEVLSALDQPDDPRLIRVHAALERWLAHYPATDRNELRGRLDDDDKCHAAFWELLLHELYRAAGFSLQPHPSIEGTSRRPDFLVSRGDSAFLLEARTVTAITDERRRRDRRLKTLTQAIDQAVADAFYVRLQILVEGDDQPPAGPVVRELQRWLATLDPDEMADLLRAQGSLRGMPSHDIATGNWVLRFTPIPVDEHRRGKLTGPMIGLGHIETSISDPTAGVRRALGRKGARYGSAPPYPLVIALAIEEPGVEDGDIEAALFGRMVMQILDVDTDPMPVRHYREDDGYWSGRRNAGSRVSAVVTTRYPRPWSAAAMVPHLWLNPWAQRPYDGPRLWSSTTVDAKTGEFVCRDAAVTTAGLLELPGDWPSSA
jgi:hypothetical protein